MATTKIWAIKDSLSRVVDYAINPKKTIFSDLKQVLLYAENKDKTIAEDEKTMYVTGVNCNRKTAFEEMKYTQEKYDKCVGNVAYHAYQSFKTGEVSPELAHKIGVELARKMWGEYQVIVATHFNTGTYHNHFVVCSVNMFTGKKFNCNKGAYYKFREISDRLCRENNLIVIDLVESIFNRYNDYLRDNNQIDFNDMINLATKYILDGKYKHNYKYVIVDEYQDISKSRYNLLLAMRKSNDYKLFCVGDDWQSIYRFSGSDIGLITNFEKYWGKTHMSKIENTYRFSDELADISGNFIMINPNQIKKNISGKKGNRFPLAIINGYTEKNCIDFLIERLLMLESNSFVYFIGRYQFDANILNCSSEFTLKYDNKSQMINVFLKSRPDLKIKFLTAHKSKGLQADYVVILNNKSKGMGFPSKISDLPIIDLLLEKSDDFPYSEERRLFYVAMTRSKKKTFLLTINNNKSIFISELEKEYDNEFKYERFECPKCGGRLIRKKGKFGYFFGCSNYPTCKYTKN